ncbi:hypothetical protein HDU93_003746 [Gonapodya sp. JEL0774]|nr:hypothetical protein HDU93_003746 [Gonapodya sp. JEL0774]
MALDAPKEWVTLTGIDGVAKQTITSGNGEIVERAGVVRGVCQKPPFNALIRAPPKGQVIAPLDALALTCRVGDSVSILINPQNTSNGSVPGLFDTRDVPPGAAVQVDVQVVGYKPPRINTTPFARAAFLKDRANEIYRAAAMSKGDVTELWKALGDYEEAISLLTPSSPASDHTLPAPSLILLTSLLLNASQAYLRLRAMGVMRIALPYARESVPSIATSTSAPNTPSLLPSGDVVDSGAVTLTDADPCVPALAHSRRAVDLSPTMAKAHYRRGTAAAAGGGWEEAESSLKMALELDPADPAPRRELEAVKRRKREEARREKEVYKRALA